MVENTIKEKVKNLIQNTEDKQIIMEIYQSELEFLSMIEKHKHELSVEKIRQETEVSKKSIEMGYIPESEEK